MRSEVQVFPGPPRSHPLRRAPGGSGAPRTCVSGELAQSGERLVCNQEVTGSSPVFSRGASPRRPAPPAAPDRVVFRSPPLPEGRGERNSPLYQRKRLAISRCIQRRWRKDRETRASLRGRSRFRGQVTKGARWMPWRRKAMKDVADCDKPRGAVSRLRSGDFRMG